MSDVHIVHFSGSITAAAVYNIRSVCCSALKEGAKDLRLHLSSDGGSSLHTFALYNFLQALPVPLTAHNTGTIESMAVVAFLAADKRLVCPNGRFLIHEFHWEFPAGLVDHLRLKERVASIDNDAERYAEIFDERTKGAKKPIAVRKHLFGTEGIVTAEKSIDAGLVQAVEPPKIPADAANWWALG